MIQQHLATPTAENNCHFGCYAPWMSFQQRGRKKPSPAAHEAGLDLGKGSEGGRISGFGVTLMHPHPRTTLTADRPADDTFYLSGSRHRLQPLKRPSAAAVAQRKGGSGESSASSTRTCVATEVNFTARPLTALLAIHTAVRRVQACHETSISGMSRSTCRSLASNSASRRFGADDTWATTPLARAEAQASKLGQTEENSGKETMFSLPGSEGRAAGLWMGRPRVAKHATGYRHICARSSCLMGPWTKGLHLLLQHCQEATRHTIYK